MSHKSLIDRWPSLGDFAEDIGTSYNTAKAMRRREKVPSEYWLAAVAGAEAREIDGVTLEAFASAVALQQEAAE